MLYEFFNGDLNKFILLLRKDVYTYEYMDSWDRFNETSLPDKESFYSNLNMEDTTDVDHRHVLIIECLKVLVIKIKVIIMICMLRVIHYCLQMFLKTLETCVLKYMN